LDENPVPIIYVEQITQGVRPETRVRLETGDWRLEEYKMYSLLSRL